MPTTGTRILGPGALRWAGGVGGLLLDSSWTGVSLCQGAAGGSSVMSQTMGPELATASGEERLGPL